MNSDTKFVTLPDGRQIAYAEYGDPNGLPTLYCHGFPGSRLEAKLFEGPAAKYNLRVLAPDRNGLGQSDAKPGRSLLDWSIEVDTFLDILNIKEYLLIGVSGGAPYALACAHQSPSRILGLTLVCPLGPLNQQELLDSMRWPARVNFKAIRDIPILSNISFRFFITPMANLWPKSIYQLMLMLAPAADSKVLIRSEVRNIITGSIHESIRQGSDAILHEMLLYTQDWGFDISEIHVPVQLWHGKEDETVPIIHGISLANTLINCSSHFIEGEGHFSLPIDYADTIQAQCISAISTHTDDSNPD
ncbi:MAG: alpha/beta hydrolase [Candidatus Thiodiazotropha sp. (ex Ctena orbiculata)]|nr:alpha/beta hydrolase [Candidatus Thiodiazotropha taylori]